MEFVLIVTLLIAIPAFYFEHKKNKHKANERLQLEEEARRRLNEIVRMQNEERDFIQSSLSELAKYANKLEQFKSQKKYLSNHDIFEFKERHQQTLKDIDSRKYKYPEIFAKEINQIQITINKFKKIDRIIAQRNIKYVELELIKTKKLFSNVEKKALDLQQRKAIIIDEDNHLIVAGAGSGKTTTVVGKVMYLIKNHKINPDSILLISFTGKAADEMHARIRDHMGVNINVKTFNKLGKDIIANVSNESLSVYDFKGTQHLELIMSFIRHQKKNQVYLKNLLDFITIHLKPYKRPHGFKTNAEHDNYLKNQKLMGFKKVKKKRGEVEITYRERLKSQEEVLIANFLFSNGIDYRYEEKYKSKTASRKFCQYKPDFFLPKFDIYIEHFGIDKNEEVPQWFRGSLEKSAKEIYWDGIKWKRSEHEKNKTTLIETYSWQQEEGVLLKELQYKLEQAGVEFNPINREELWQILYENAKPEIDEFTELVATFLVLFKSNNLNFSKLKRLALKEKDNRALRFFDLFKPIYLLYNDYLRREREIDFSDMINRATALIKARQYISHYKYIIIDEYQDISNSRFSLIKALLDQKPDTKLFCVGDDWQSIFRFAGSDIGFFTEFNLKFKSSKTKGFKRKTQSSFIENTYRFDNQLIKLTSDFVLKNPNQLPKQLKSSINSTESPFSVFYYSDPERKGEEINSTLVAALSKIHEHCNGKSASVLLIGRYSNDRRSLQGNNFLEESYNAELKQYEYYCRKFDNLKIRFLTAHKSKGLQDDYVIIINCSSGTFGFPSEISDDPLLNYLLSMPDQYPNGEERRLFYVAMTRAKKHVSFLVNKNYPSKFMDEIQPKEKIDSSLKCEWCDLGILVERQGSNGPFYSCNNYHLCNFTKNLEPN
jgi:DNA helicase-4